MSLVRRSPEETRKCILQTAWELFRQIGLRKTTVADIAETLGMSSGNIYRFFPSKDALTDAVCRDLLGALIAGARAAASGPGSASERLTNVLLFLHGQLRDQMTNEKRVHEVVAVALEENWPAVLEFVDASSAIAIELVREGQARGEFGPGDPELLGEMAMSACAVIHHPTMIAQCGRLRPDFKAEELAEFVLRALANREPAHVRSSLESAS